MKRYFDVNVFVYYLLGDPTYGKIAYNWIKETEERLTSIITPFEVSIVVSKLLNTNLRDMSVIGKIFQAFKDLGIRLVEIDWDHVYYVAVKYKLDLEDAIHVSCGLKENAEIISNDEELKSKVNAKF
ncbi:MAG: PIN domain-containing protein [Saccharolobus sp.]